MTGTAKKIGKQAWDEYKDNTAAAIKYIKEAANEASTTEAIKTIHNAKATDYNIFEECNMLMINLGSNKLSKEERITKLAYLILKAKAIEYYLMLSC